MNPTIEVHDLTKYYGSHLALLMVLIVVFLVPAAFLHHRSRVLGD